MIKMTFNRNPIVTAGTIEQPSMDEVRNTPQLFNASLDDALKYGGDLTREAIGAMNLRLDKRHVIVDTKVHMLMPGFYPAIPGWHTDAAPRGPESNPLNSQGPNPPNLFLQEENSSPRFHLLVTGEGALTKFITHKTTFVIPDEPTVELYKDLTDRIVPWEYALGSQFSDYVQTIPTCTVWEWDWWTLHTATPATKNEWRFLIRVTETDYSEPESNLRNIIRTQSNVYVPESFGW